MCHDIREGEGSKPITSQSRRSSQGSAKSAATGFFRDLEKVSTPPLSPAEIAKRVREYKQADRDRESEWHVPTTDQIVSAKDPHEPPFVSNAARFNDKTRYSVGPMKRGSKASAPPPSSLRQLPVERPTVTRNGSAFNLAQSRPSSLESLSATHTDATPTAQTSGLDLSRT